MDNLRRVKVTKHRGGVKGFELGWFHKWIYLTDNKLPKPVLLAVVENDEGYVNYYDATLIQFDPSTQQRYEAACSLAIDRYSYTHPLQG